MSRPIHELDPDLKHFYWNVRAGLGDFDMDDAARTAHQVQEQILAAAAKHSEVKVFDNYITTNSGWADGPHFVASVGLLSVPGPQFLARVSEIVVLHPFIANTILQHEILLPE